MTFALAIGRLAPAGRARPSYRLTFAVVAFACTIYSVLSSLAAPAIPVLRHDLHTTENGVAWILTSYLLSSSVATPLVGRMGDIYGKRRMFVVQMAALSLGLLLSCLASTLPLMLVGRVIQGAAGGMFPLAFGMIRDEFPREKVSGGIGMLSAALGVGGGVGVVLSGVIAEHLGYHWLFWIPFVGAVLGTVAALAVLPDSPVRAPARIPWIGAILLSGGLFSFLLAVSEATTWGWGSARTIGLMALGTVVLAGWVMVERVARQPLVDMRVMALPAVWRTNLTAALIGVGMYSAILLLPQLVSVPRSTGFGFGKSITGAGLFLLPLTISMLVVSILAGRLERRYSSKPPLVVGAMCSTAGFLVLAAGDRHQIAVYVASALLGCGIGLAFSAMANLIVGAVPQDQVGVATGINNISRTLGGAVGTQVAASVIASDLITRTRIPALGGFSISFWVVAAFMLSAAVVASAIPNPGRVRTGAAQLGLATPGGPAPAGAVLVAEEGD